MLGLACRSAVFSTFPKQQHNGRQDFIDEAFERFEGACALPDILAAFTKLDKESNGFLDRPRFALALRSLRPSLELPPSLLRTAMNLFDTDDGETGGDGRGSMKGVGRGGSGRIDYRQVKEK